MKIVCFADSHGMGLDELIFPSNIDILICAGDVSGISTLEDIIRFSIEFTSIPAKRHIFVAGNHEIQLDIEKTNMSTLAEKILQERNITYLKDSGVEIEGLKIYGTPWSPPFMEWAFMKREIDLVKNYNLIPQNTDMVITHCPPTGVMDMTVRGLHCGSSALRKRIWEIKPRYHIFGHIHASSGITKDANTTFINCAVLNDIYEHKFQPREVHI